MNTGTDGRYPTGNLAFPGTTIGTPVTNFVVNTTTNVYIPDHRQLDLRRAIATMDSDSR